MNRGMPFDFSAVDDLRFQGLNNYHDGLAAEDAVALRYSDEGYDLQARRWRGEAGEIDLIFEGDDGFVFVEVKKSSSHARAVEALSWHQMQRICLAAEEYAGAERPGQLVNMRLDLATVDGLGQIEVLQNISL